MSMAAEDRRQPPLGYLLWREDEGGYCFSDNVETGLAVGDQYETSDAALDAAWLHFEAAHGCKFLDDGDACALLEEAGYELTDDMHWKAPPRPATPQEFVALLYLQDEWDYGWIVEGGAAE